MKMKVTVEQGDSQESATEEKPISVKKGEIVWVTNINHTKAAFKGIFGGVFSYLEFS
jgi:hypothetical protein